MFTSDRKTTPIEALNPPLTLVLRHKKGSVSVAWAVEGDSIQLSWPSYLNDEGVTIIGLDVEEGFGIDKTTRQFADGRIEINCLGFEGPGGKAYPRYRGFQNRLFMHDWRDASEYVTTEFILHEAGIYATELVYASQKGGVRGEGMEGLSTVGGKLELTLGDSVQEFQIQDNEQYQDPKSVSIGTVEFKKSGTYKLKVKPIDDGNWNGFSFQGVSMKLKKELWVSN